MHRMLRKDLQTINVTWFFLHDDVIKWKHFPRSWPFVREIHRSPVNSPHKGQWRGALTFSLIYAWINGWVNNREAGDLRRHRVHNDVTVMVCDNSPYFKQRASCLLAFTSSWVYCHGFVSIAGIILWPTPLVNMSCSCKTMPILRSLLGLLCEYGYQYSCYDYACLWP